MALFRNQEENENEIEESPLLARSMQSQRSQEQKNVQSTIHPERFDMSRFSDMNEEKENSFRIIIYVVVIIIVGVGATLLVRSLISNNNPQETTEQTDNTTTQTPSPVTINATPVSDSNATDIPSNEILIDSALQSLGSATVDANGVTVDTLSYNAYSSFGRLEFGMGGIDLGLPKLTVEFDSLGTEMKLTIPTGVTVANDLTAEILIDDIVESVTFDSSTSVFTITLSEPSKYRTLIKDNSLVIDFKSIAQIEEDEQEASEPVEEPVVEEPVAPTTDPSKPTGNSYDNVFSRNKQYVTSSLTGNTIGMNETYFEDTGTHFELAWGAKNLVGESYIPNATAEMITEGGKTYIDVTIENLSAFVVANSLDQSKIPFTLATANFVSSKVVSFSSGVAKIRVELKNAADFRLASEKTISGQTQVLVLQIKD